MPPAVQVGAILIEESPLTRLLGLEREPYSGNWSLVKALDGFALDRKIRASGWNFFFMAAEEKAMFFGAPGVEKIYEGAMLRYLQNWIDQLRWQRLAPMEKLAAMLLKHLEGILNYCRTKVPMGVVEAVNGNIKALLRRGRGYRDLNYLLLKAQRLAVTKTEFVAFKKAA